MKFPVVRVRDKDGSIKDILGIRGAQGLGLPEGGKPGQILVKQGIEDYDTKWTSLEIGTEGISFNFDTQMSETSQNGVQNKVIKNYIDQTVQNLTDYPKLENGKLPFSVIPNQAITEYFTIQNEKELVTLDAQKGDIAQIIGTQNGVPTIKKTWVLSSDSPSKQTDWIVWNNDYASEAEHAKTADRALESEEAKKINGIQLVSINRKDWENLNPKDENTFYLVFEEDI